jgi:hypothetical protein
MTVPGEPWSAMGRVAKSPMKISTQVTAPGNNVFKASLF